MTKLCIVKVAFNKFQIMSWLVKIAVYRYPLVKQAFDRVIKNQIFSS